ncbi:MULTISPECIES: helix-turn-helix transcriptional regulator [unclassified Butyrivibrio]|uniref:helix-turn-helix transcriptional regulator n=1 Tax=unclassified Butyrivibrio TaxID=2639466 RepID=UPI0003B5D662|nr:MULTISPECIES: WYL domain-containing protein [unclassified Butyrivibrio]
MIKVYGTETKKMLNLLILDVLQRYSDADHTLTQQAIIRILRSDYGVEKIDRRSVKANVLSLVDMGYEISMEEGNGYYLMSREFEDAELRLLIDSVLFSKTISDAYAKRLIEKLKSFGNIYFDMRVSHVKPTPTMNRTDNKQVLYNVSAIDDAIDNKKKISFHYCKYGLDFKMHDLGRNYVVNPYQMVASGGHYYLLGNLDKYDDVAYYRIDKMTNVVILDEKVKPQKEVVGLDGQLNLSKHMAEHIYMFCGETLNVTLKTTPGMMDALVDWFGKDFKILKSTEDKLEILVRCNENAMFCWALQYGPQVEVLAPASLRADLAKEIKKMNDKYHNDN